MPQKDALAKKLKEQIRSQDALRLDHYIEACLWDAEDGYYRRKDVFGSKGDFTTSPEISQIFGEVTGLWALQSWHEMGKPTRFTLLEMGAGRGLWMRDILRTTSIDPAFTQALDLHILEKSPARRKEQQSAIPNAITFLDAFTLPPQPAIIISNEFFDALPIRQFRNEGGGWLEAFLNDKLEKTWQPCPHPPQSLASHIGAPHIIEINPSMIEIGRILGDHLRQHQGRILTIDYGEFDGQGDTLQAIQNHQPTDPFAHPGHADLTAHIRFGDLALAAELNCDFMRQAEFLHQYGGVQRLENLKRANPSLAENLQAGYDRLTDPKQMGTLFKVLIQSA